MSNPCIRAARRSERGVSRRNPPLPPLPPHRPSWWPGRPLLKAKGEESLRTLARALNERGIPTARGEGQWKAAQVARILRRLGNGAGAGAPPDRRPGAVLFFPAQRLALAPQSQRQPPRFPHSKSHVASVNPASMRSLRTANAPLNTPTRPHRSPQILLLSLRKSGSRSEGRH